MEALTSMGLIKGIPITLWTKTSNENDPFGMPIWTEKAETIENVLIHPLSEEDKATELNLTGKKVVYELCIPKGDTNEWTDRKVTFYGEDFRTVGIPTELIGFMVPLDWNKKIKVERYE